MRTAVACVVLLALTALIAQSRSGSHPPALYRGARSSLATRLSSSLASAASPTIGASERSFWSTRHDGSLTTRGGSIHSTFTASGVALQVAQGNLSLSLVGVGWGRRFEPITAAIPARAANQVIFHNRSVTELYRNGPYGLEQSFDLKHRPHAGTGSLVLTLRIGGSLLPEKAGSQILFKTRTGATVLHYGQLSAVDATGRGLPSQMQLHGDLLQLLIDDRGARYPVHVDPFVAQGNELKGSEVAEADATSFGGNVAISADGGTALISGGDGAEGGNAVWVFTRSGDSWIQQGPKLTGFRQSGNSGFGDSLALSADGDTALIGGAGDDYGRGAVWVFTRSESIWTQDGEKLTGAEEGGREESGEFGGSVALSADGDTALIGGAGVTSSGGAWVFTRSESTWTQQGKMLTPAETNGESEFGSGVALSSDGDTALIGGQYDDRGVGAAWVFTRSGEIWTQQGEKLTGAGENGEGWFGRRVALSSDGDTALIGAPFDHPPNSDAFSDSVGAAWVFTRSGETWTEQGPKLTGGEEEFGDGEFGDEVALSGDGGTALIGGSADHDLAGAVWVFSRAGSTWKQAGTKLAESEMYGNAYFGSSVALAAESGVALISSPGDDSVWTFAPGIAQPSVVTGSASSLGVVSATLNATVIPGGKTVERCFFEYGASTSYGSSAPCTSLPGSGEVPVAVAASVVGLNAGATYHFRIVATNLEGTSYGSDETFNTVPSGLGSVTFTSSYKVEEYEVPWGVTRVLATVIGGPGATSYGPGGGAGADGARAVAELVVTPGETLYVVVGGAGSSGPCGSGRAWGEGGSGDSSCGGSSSGGGGGASSIRTCPNSFTPSCPTGDAIVRSELLVAGGGGGGGSGTDGSKGGAGGGAEVDGMGAPGQPGEAVLGGAPGGGGGGGTLSTGGEPGSMTASCSGGNLDGSGRFDEGGGGGLYETAGGGGGGGWYGGGGGGGGGKTSCGGQGGGGGGGGGGASYGPAGASFSQDTSGSSLVTIAPIGPLPPNVETKGAAFSGTAPMSMTLSATVNPNGGMVSDCHFEYGATTSYGSSAPCAALPGAGSGAVEVSAHVADVSAGATYHFRIVATNAAATAYGNDETVTAPSAYTPPQGHIPPPVFPLPVQTSPEAAASTASSSATSSLVSPGPSATTAPVPDAELTNTSLRMSSPGSVTIELSCPAGEISCAGTATLRTLTAVTASAGEGGGRSRQRKAILTLAVGSFEVPGGETKALKLRLSTGARALLADVKLLRARATIVAHDAAGATHTAQVLVTIRAPDAAHGRKS